MRLLVKISLTIIAFSIVASVLFLATLYLNILGGFILSTILLATLILLIIHAVISLFNKKRRISTNILILLLSVLLIPFTNLLPVGNAMTYFYHPFLSKGELTPTKKIGYVEMLLTGNISSAALMEEYKEVDREGLTFYLPDNSDYSKWIEIVNSVMKDSGDFRDEFWVGNRAANIRIVFTKDLGSERDFNTFGKYQIVDKSIHLKVPSTLEEESMFKSTVLHEITHLDYYETAERSGVDAENLPMWFTEGIASYVDASYTITHIDEFKDVKWVPFDELKLAQEWGQKLIAPYHPYLQSRLFVQELVNRYDSGIILNLIKESKENGFDHAFEQLTGETVESFGQGVIEKAETLAYDFYNLERDNLVVEEQGLSEMLSFVPNLNEVNHGLAWTYIEQGQFDRAIEMYENLVQTGMASYITHTDLINLYVLLEKWSQADQVASNYEHHKESAMLADLEEHYNSMKRAIDSGKPIEGYIYFIENTANWSFHTKQLIIDALLEKYDDMESEEREKLEKLKTGEVGVMR